MTAKKKHYLIKVKYRKRKSRLETEWSWKRGIMCGGAAVVGGAALVFTGGLAAPAVAAGFTALGSTTCNWWECSSSWFFFGW